MTRRQITWVLFTWVAVVGVLTGVPILAQQGEETTKIKTASSPAFTPEYGSFVVRRPPARSDALQWYPGLDSIIVHWERTTEVLFSYEYDLETLEVISIGVDTLAVTDTADTTWCDQGGCHQ